ncbi:uncharacterized protein LOC120281179 [Dioscorea cayenensis subsp. rotundata]|uniref:Uncharacterized protein LOC120281179 n=1 Tax=Dioscorea cayennensis subsp. rotundata TaxID=55577 RepID=A0AB40CVG3_DIOCR|nr:uncharacterized protein LOC120281179 [Dioscorea cayenensis subsp. rotundata]
MPNELRAFIWDRRSRRHNLSTATIPPVKNDLASDHNHSSPPAPWLLDLIAYQVDLITTLLLSLISPFFTSLFVGPESSDLAALADSDRPARALLDSPAARTALSLALSHPSSGAGDDPLCQWLYDTLQSPDLDLRLVPLSFIPLVSGLYLSRVISGDGATPSLAGFEAVLLAVYSSEVKARAGRPVLISIPDLSLPSLYHTP